MELINCESYKSLCDNVFDGNSRYLPDHDSLIYVPLDNFSEFSSLCEHSEHRFVVVSACSDYCAVYQDRHPIWRDMHQWINGFIQLDESFGYNTLVVPARCNLEKCKLNEQYSIKMHSFTHSTLDNIPDNIVNWFCTNNEIEDNRITRIPFGIGTWTDPIIQKVRSNGLHLNRDRKTKLYVNHQNYTRERIELKRACSQMSHAKVVKDELSKEDYIADLLNSEFVLCPESNGFDSYRILEAIYCGAIPVIFSNNLWTMAYSGLNPMITRNFNDLVALEYATVNSVMTDLGDTCADLSFWRNQIRLAADKL